MSETEAPRVDLNLAADRRRGLPTPGFGDVGERLAGLDELTDDDLAALLHVLDALVAKNRVQAALTSRTG